jgi:hypothetical protein
MSDRAHALVKAFYHEPLREYRKAVLQVREQGGLAESELRFIERRVDPVDAEMIRRHATLDDQNRE